jgi:sugar phosphate isomerase/epimerase
LGVGIDPAALLLAGLDPLQGVSKAGPSLKSARLSDASPSGRITPGDRGGRLDLLGYAATLGVAGCTRQVILDLRGLQRQAEAAERARSAWDSLGL